MEVLIRDGLCCEGDHRGAPLSAFRRARHTKGDSKGKKLPRENSYTVPKRCFEHLDTINEVVTKLFGKAVTS
jgi:hypothetical protein